MDEREKREFEHIPDDKTWILLDAVKSAETQIVALYRGTVDGYGRNNGEVQSACSKKAQEGPWRSESQDDNRVLRQFGQQAVDIILKLCDGFDGEAGRKISDLLMEAIRYDVSQLNQQNEAAVVGSLISVELLSRLRDMQGKQPGTVQNQPETVQHSVHKLIAMYRENIKFVIPSCWC